MHIHMYFCQPTACNDLPKVGVFFFPQLTLINPQNPDAKLWLAGALAWYKDASERGAEHLSLLTQNLPVGGWLGFSEAVSRLHREPWVSKAAFSPPAGGGSSCSAARLVANQGGSGRVQLTGRARTRVGPHMSPRAGN